ncbi:Ig-like domain-containing protein [Coriobacteriia bacterium Es71-Z0120]|uniref:multiheme c-type cytochrome n=1 Tax=Parvivirga hydrogeniphila TaxID=2939460 RepID=UPI002260F39F|nr:cytochrome c3 family protein [Parvivirga hydrogeniphila]MCL4079188.1 Ig-like domain-containing protein [Parvivirga hydrogeniphila]
MDTNDGDSTYASTNSLNAAMYLAIDDLPVANATINSVTINVVARTLDDDQMDIGYSNAGAAPVYDSNRRTLSTSYATYSWSPANAPDGTSWDVTDVNNLQVVVKAIKGSNPLSVLVTEVSVVVDYTPATPTLTVAQGADPGRPTAKQFVGQGATGRVVDELALTAQAGNGDVTVTQIVVRGLDTAAALLTDVSGVKLYRDDGDGVFDGGDTQIGTTQTFSGNASGSTATFGGLGLTVADGTTAKIWIVYDIGASAVDGHALGSRVNNGDVTVSAGQTVNAFTDIISANTGQTLQVDAAPPTADTTSPANNAVLTGSSATVSGTASDGSGSGVASVQVAIQRSDGQYWNGTGWTASQTWNAATGTTSWTYAWSLDAGQNREYTYTITARATDNVGLQGADASPVTGVRVDNTGPSIASVTPPTSATSVDVVFDEDLDGASISASDFTIAGLTVSAANLQPDNKTVRLTTSEQTPGQSYTVSVSAGQIQDVYGNANELTQGSFTGYQPVPSLSVAPGADVPPAKVYVLRSSTHAVDQFELSASNGDVTVTQIVVRGLDTTSTLQDDVSSVRLYLDDGDDVFDAGDSQVGTAQAFSGQGSGSTATFSGLALTVSPGSPRRVWIVYDVGALAGNGHAVGSQIVDGDVTVSAPATVSFTTSPITSANGGQTLEVDAYSPVVSVLSPTPSSITTAQPTIISGTASDDPDGGGPLTGSGVASVQVRITRSDGSYWNGSTWVAASDTWLAATGSANWTYSWTLPANEQIGTYSYTIEARASDATGNAPGLSPAVTGVQVDTRGPSIVSAAAVDTTTVDVVFSEPLSASTVQASDFTFTGGLSASAAVLQADNVTVRVTTSPQTAGQSYVVQVAAGSLADAQGVGNPSTDSSFVGYTPPVEAALHPDGVLGSLGGYATQLGNNNWNVQPGGGTSSAEFVTALAASGDAIFAQANSSGGYLNLSIADLASTPQQILSVDLVFWAQATGSARPLSASVYESSSSSTIMANSDFTITVSGSYQQYAVTDIPDPGGDGWTLDELNALAVQLNETGQGGTTAQIDELYLRVTYVPLSGAVLSVVQSSGAADRPSGTVYVTQAQSAVVDAYELSASGGPVSVSQIDVTGLDTANTLQTDVTAVRIFEDTDADGLFYDDGADTLVGSATFDGDVSGVAKASVTGLNYLVPDGATKRLWVVYQIGASALDGHAVGSRLQSSGIQVSSGSVNAFADIDSAASGSTLAIDAAGPTVTISQPADASVLTGTSTTIAGTASDGGSGVNAVQVRIGRSDGTWWDDSSKSFTPVEVWNNANGAESWTFVWGPHASGQNREYLYSISARGVDNVSNTGATESRSVRIDNQGPAVSSASALNETTVDVLFSEPLDPATVEASDFSIPGLTISDAVVQSGDARVRLTTSPQTPGQAYTVSVLADAVVDPYGNGSRASSAGFLGYGGGEDTQPPSMPSSVVATAGTAPPVIAVISWSASTDNVGVTGYRVYRATSETGEYRPLGTTTSLSFSDVTGVPGQSYWYKVSAYDAAGNESALSAAVGPVTATWKQAPHATYTSSTRFCAFCHEPHQAATQHAILRDAGEAPSANSTCYVCHDGSGASTNVKTGPENSFALTSGHSLEETTTDPDLTNDCASCHGPHGDYTVKPMLPRSTINSVSVAAADNTWCFACHNATNDWYGPGYPSVSAPVKDGSGYPVSGTFPGPSTYTSPTANAHASIPGTASAGREDGDCLYCHASHRSATQYDALIATFTAPTTATVTQDQTTGDFAWLCFECHGSKGHSVLGTSPAGIVDIQQFVTAGAPRSGHRIKTAGGRLPAGAPLPCYDCHNPHGSTRGNARLLSDERGRALETSTAAGVRAFCFTCHSSSDGMVWDSVAATYTAVGTDSIEGLRRDGSVPAGNVLRLPNVSGHGWEDARSCYQCHGSSYAPGGNNVHNPSGGVSGGGQPCYTCHAVYQQYMEDGSGSKSGDNRATVHHHVLGGAAGDGDIAPATSTAYPTSQDDVYCVSCHTDHNYFNGSPAANLRASIASSDGTPTVATDFVDGAGSGICVSCHQTSRAKDVVDQKTDGTFVTQPISGAAFDVSAHQYGVASEFGSGNTFSADCSKCHNDEQAKDFQTSTYRFGTHYSASSRILSAFGAEATETVGKWHCYGCHSEAGGFPNAKTVPGRDWYGSAGATMAAIAERVYDQFETVGQPPGSSHPLGTGAGTVVCESCHNPHVVRSQEGSRVTDPENTLRPAPYSTTIQKAAFCFNCHDGSGVTYQSNDTTYVPASVTMVDPADDKGAYAARGHWSAWGAISAGEIVPCGTCHDNHGSSAPKLLGEYDAATGQNRIGSTSITANDNTVCRACHTTMSTDFPASEAQRATNGYLDTGTWPGFGTYDVIYTPVTHTGSPHTAAEAVWPSSGYAPGDCKNCHDVHGTANTYDELVATFDPSSPNDDQFELCFTCHDGTKGTDIKGLYPVSAGGTNASLRSGHRVVSSVAGAKLAQGQAVPCYDCHNPHGSASAYALQVRDIGDGAGEINVSTVDGRRKFCFACHTPQDTTNGWSGSAWVAVGTTTVEGLRRDGSDGSRLKLPSISMDGHKQGDTQDCYGCHGGPTASSTNNVHNPTGGVSNGGADCYGCHATYQGYMEDGSGTKTGANRTTVYHHVLGSATYDGDKAFAPGAYPSSTTDVYCLSCHVDHDKFNPSASSNLRPDLATANPAGTNTDYSTSTNTGVCTKCHAASLAKDTTNRKNDGRTATPKIVEGAGAGQFGTSAHSYAATSTFGDSTTFYANCSKCHNDEDASAYKTAQRSTYRFGPHWSTAQHIVSALGGAVTDQLQEEHCYRCHSLPTDGLAGTKKSVAGKDWYGVADMPTAGSELVYQQFALASKHPVVAAGGDSVECESCHNAHAVSASARVSDPDNTYNLAAYGTVAEKSAFCLKCHDGALPSRTISGATYVPYTVTQADAATNNKSTYAARGHWSASGSISAAETKSCAECHDNHGSAYPKLLGAYDPATKTNRINGQAITGNNNTVCQACHNAASTGYPAGTRDASGYIADGTWPGFTTYNASAHTTANGGGSSSLPNMPAAGDCKVCHDVHGTANTYDELRATYGSADFVLCFECHDADGPAARNIKGYYPISVGGAGGGSGHRIATSGGTLTVNDALPCYDCHNPHGSSAADFMLQVRDYGDAPGEITHNDPNASDGTNLRRFCFLCHSSSDGQVWDPGTSSYVAVGTDLVEGLRRDGTILAGQTAPSGYTHNWLKLKALSGSPDPHSSTSTKPCYDCHGRDYSTAASNNVHNPSGGVSSGGQECYGCHAYQAYMEDGSGTKTGANRTTVYHHVLGGTMSATYYDGDLAPNTGAYPDLTNSTRTDVFCVSCHSDHNYFNASKSGNLRTSVTAAGSSVTNRDFPGSGTYGVCVSCHDQSLAKDTVNRKSDGRTATPIIAGAGFDVSAHDYEATSTFSDSTTFYANCSKCHNDEQTKDWQSGTGKQFGPHWSTAQHIVSALGGAVTDQLQEEHCYRCHSLPTDGLAGTKKSVAGKDWYGVADMPTAGSELVYQQFALASKHPVVAAGGDSVECESCHNAHAVSASARVSDPDNTYNLAAYGTVAEKSAFCLKCHDGALPSRTISGATYVPYTVTQADAATNNKSTYAARGHWSASGSISAAETKSCAECHDNHGSAYPKLLGAYDPATKTNRINGQAITGNNNTVCQACHNAASTGYPTFTPETGTGYPMDGTWPGMTVYSGANGIHRSDGDGQLVVWPGSSFTDGDCKNCHDVHGTANTYDELRGTFTKANFGNCFTCHDGDPSSVNIKQYYPTTNGGDQTQAADTNYGHKIQTPGGNLTAGDGLPCYDCHNPHGNANSTDGLLVRTMTNSTTTIMIGDAAGEIDMSTDAGVRRFCFSCHTTADTTAGWNGTGYAAVSAGANIEGIDRTVYDSTNKRGLKLPPVSGHNQADTQSCYGCHGNSYANATSNNVHNPGPGGSNGGIDCLNCHGSTSTERYDRMVSDTTYYHHVLDSGTPGQAPGTGTYPNSTTALACVSCHTDHNYFNANKGSNLRTSISNTSGASNTNTDFIAGGSPSYGICLSCHSSALTKNTTGQKTTGASSQTPAISGAAYDVSAHDYEVTSSFGTSTFRANCVKCHDDEQDSLKSYQTSTYKFGTHYSAENRIAKALGVALAGTSTSSEENLCFTCHTGGTAGNDAYGAKAMDAQSRSIQSEFAETYKHNVAGYSGVHRSDESVSAPTQVTPSSTTGWWGTSNANRHVECEDCHNPHEAQPGTYYFPTDNTQNNRATGANAVPISAANKGVWGVNITGATNGNWAGDGTFGSPTQPSYDKVTTAAYEWQMCLKCHSIYAWGQQTRPQVMSLKNANGPMTDVGLDFSPKQYAIHPLFAQGKNQPPANTYGTWNSSTKRRNIGGTSTGWGLSNTFVDGWLATSRVTCSDCHGNDTWTNMASGPHGSGYRWILRGYNTGVKTTTAGGVVNLTTADARSFCNNCHRVDVYADAGGSNSDKTAVYLSRTRHVGDVNSSCIDPTKLTVALTGCQNCHGGRVNDNAIANGALHGTSMLPGDGNNGTNGLVQDGAPVGDPMGYRFCNGAAWDAHLLGDTSGTYGCSTLNNTDGYSSCTQHSGTWGKSVTPNYYYARPTN